MFVITNGCMKFLRQDLDFLSYIYKPILACLNRNNLHTFLNLRDKKKTKEDNASFYEDFMAFFFLQFFFHEKRRTPTIIFNIEDVVFKDEFIFL